MTARAQCAAVSLRLGRRVRCTVQTAIRSSVVVRGRYGERLFDDDRLPRIERVPVCSAHSALVDREGWSALDPDWVRQRPEEQGR